MHTHSQSRSPLQTGCAHVGKSFNSETKVEFSQGRILIGDNLRLVPFPDNTAWF